MFAGPAAASAHAGEADVTGGKKTRAPSRTAGATGKVRKASSAAKPARAAPPAEAVAETASPVYAPQPAIPVRRNAAVVKAVDAVLHPGLGAPTGHRTAPAVQAASRRRKAPLPAANPAASSDAPPPAVAAVAPPATVQPEAPPRAPVLPAGSAAAGAASAALEPPAPDLDVLARNMTSLLEESGKVATELYKPREGRPAAQPFRSDMSDAVRTLGQVAEHWFADPARFIQAQSSLTAGFFDLWVKSAGRFTEGAKAKPDDEPVRPVDKRFSDPEWRANPVFDFLHRAFLLGTDWANDLVDKADLDPDTRERARFYVRQMSSALSPSNFVPTNPELLRETLKESGGNLVRGMKMLAEDIAAGGGDLRIRHTDTSKFELGVNMALTPGKVVFRNDLMELLQYAPSTPEVLKRPLLIVPPWINKFYILDLNPDKSFIRWAVAQGLTVFVISWVNPDARHAAKDFEAYMREGILAALDEIETITGEKQVSTIGYCVGGTLLAVTLAYMAARGDDRIASATLFTAQVDFTHAGDLKVFAEEQQISALEAQMTGQGYLPGSKMAQAFNMLRPEDLIWTSAVNTYLRGNAPRPFDLLAWNSDSARMPAANHSFYLRNCYLENNLAKGLMEIAGQRLDLKRITIPIYNLATREDHIAPAVSVFAGCRFFGGPVRYVLSGSGHVAGVVNPPDKGKYGYAVGPVPLGDFATWLDAAEQRPGSWWPDWAEWIREQAPETVPAREPGGGRPTLGDAPGSYVRVKS